MKNFLGETITGLGFLVLLFFTVNPYKIFMPSKMDMVLLAFSVILFALFATFILRESTKDEREVFHRMLVDRYSYLAGSAVVLIAITVQALNHNIDNWLFVVLSVMVLTKIISLVYVKNRY